MHWADIFLVGLVFGGTYLGGYRGLVLEVTDWLMLLGSAFMGYRLYRWLGGALHASFLKGWGEDWVYGFAFLFFALPTFILILSLGLHLDRVTKEQDRLPPELRKYGGGLVAVVKYVVLSGLWVGFMNGSTLMTDSELGTFRKAGVVSAMRNMNGLGVIMVRIAAPSDIADKFIKNMNKT